MSAYIAEFIGTAMLVMKGGGNVHILIGWGMAVMVPAFSFGAMSGAHFNPAVTIGAAMRGGMSWGLVPGYIVAQMLGGFVGAAILMVLYGDHIKQTADDACVRGCFCTGPSIRNTVVLYGDHIKQTADDACVRGCFCTGPSIRNTVLNFLSEFVATFVLVFTLASIPGEAGASGASWILVYGVIVACGASFGGLTGYAMNAARDAAPRFAYQVLAPNFGKKDPDWAYGW